MFFPCHCYHRRIDFVSVGSFVVEEVQFSCLPSSILVFVSAEERLNSQASMLLFTRKRLLPVLSGCVILFLLTPTLGASGSSENLNQSYRSVQPLELTPKLSFQLKLHAFLLWSSVGFLMPIGVLLIRVSSNVKSAKSVKVLFYCHVASQIVAVILATAGAVLSMSNFENAFNNTHQRIGLALYGFIWLQPLIGFLRPDRGVKVRSVWYMTHWLLGIGVCVVGVANVYTGLHTYRERTGRSVRPWTMLLTVEVSGMALVYLVQDRWNHVGVRQGEAAAGALGDERMIVEEAAYPANDHKEVAVLP